MRNIKKYISTALLGAVISLPSMASTMAAPIHIPSPQNIIDTSNPVVEVRRRGGISRGRGARRGGFSRGRGYIIAVVDIIAVTTLCHTSLVV